VRNAIELLASGPSVGGLTMQLTVWSPIQAISTALVAAVVLVVFQRWLDIRLEA
jgi:hypothetical protein